MKATTLQLLLGSTLLLGTVALSPAQLQLLPAAEPHRVFAGKDRQISLVWRNTSDKPVTALVHAQLYQASSATAAPWNHAPWKRLELLPGQTLLEDASLDFPEVRAETRFLIQWLNATNRVLGKTDVLVYPPDLLQGLKPLTGDEPLGVFDPENRLKALLKPLGVEFLDLEETSVAGFRGKLALIGPFGSKAQMREALPVQIKTLATKGTGVVWMLPRPEPREELKPSFYTVLEGKGAVVVVQPGLVANLPESPQAQLNLLHFARLALHPEPPRLPYLSLSPSTKSNL